MGTRPWTIAVLLLVASYLVGWASTYSLGAPDSACSSMMPGHGPPAQSNGSPFSLTPSAVSVEPGQRMLVTLESTTGTDRFMGFIVQARDAETDLVLGTFFTTDHKYLTCAPGFNNTVTHHGPSQKSKVVLEWEPKSDFQGDIVFKGSFVKNYCTFWVGVTSEKVTVVKREPPLPTVSLLGDFRPRNTTPPPTTTTTTDAPKIADSISSPMDSIYLGCGSVKGCFGYPDNCVKKQNCDFLMTYTKSPADNGYRFEISGDIKDGPAGYVAAGLSSDTSMGDDSVMICHIDGGITDVLMGWNKGKQNSLLEDINLGITNERTAFVDGRVYCTFIRNIETEILGNDFNLDNNEYNLMLSSGGVKSGGGIGYHTSGRVVSGGQVNLGEFASVEAKSDRPRITTPRPTTSTITDAPKRNCLCSRLTQAERSEYEGQWGDKQEFVGNTSLVSVAVPVEFVQEVNNYINMLMAMDYVTTNHRSILIY